MQRSFDARAIVLGERAYAMSDVVDILTCNRLAAELDRSAGEASFGFSPKVHDHFDQVFQFRLPVKGFTKMRR
jgi:hypothetical protein